VDSRGSRSQGDVNSVIHYDGYLNRGNQHSRNVNLRGYVRILQAELYHCRPSAYCRHAAGNNALSVVYEISRDCNETEIGSDEHLE